MSRFRHLPPTAVPIRASDLRSGLSNSQTAVASFQSALAEYLGVDQEACKVAASGRTALYCLLNGLKSKNPSRRQVVMPAYTCPAVARVAVDLDLQPVFVDIACETMGYLLDSLETAVTEETLAVVQVHPFGIPLPSKDVIAVAHEQGAVVIEDAAQALGAKWNGKAVGTDGDFGLYSLGPGKPISTGGGGIAIANSDMGIRSLNEWWADLPRPSGSGSAVAWTRQVIFQLLFQPNMWWGATRIGLHRVGNHETSWGYTVQGLAPSQASVGLKLLPRLDDINGERRRKAALLQEVVSQSTRLRSVAAASEAEPFYLRYPLVAESEEQREIVFNQFWSAGIGAGRLYERTLPSLFDAHDSRSYPGAEAVAGRLLTVPTHHNVSEKDIAVMCGILEQFK